MAETRDIYKIVKDVAERNKSVKQLKFILDDDDFTVEKTGTHGSLNEVYSVKSKDKTCCLIFKHAQEQMSDGDLSDVYMTLERQTLEYNGLRMLNHLLPGSVPQPYCLDMLHHIIVMEDVSDMRLLGDVLGDGDVDVTTAGAIGDLMGQIQHLTHRQNVNIQTWQTYQQTLRNDSVRDTITTYRVYVTADENHAIIKVPDVNLEVFKHCVSQMKTHGLLEKIESLNKREDCFIHSDLHCYSVFIAPDRIAMIDLEFAYLGNQAYGVGFILAFYYMQMVEAQEKDKAGEKEIRDKYMQASRALVEHFLQAFGDRVDMLGPLPLFFSEMALFLGSVLFGYPGFVHIENIVKLTSAGQKLECIQRGFSLMMCHTEMTDIDNIIKVLYDGV